MRMRAVSHLITRGMRLPPVTTPEVRVQRDLDVPMRDGVVLKSDRYTPVSDTQAPLVLCRSPYGRSELVGSALLGWPLSERGFQVLVVSTRGTAGSGGTLDPWNERDDGLDTIAWMRAQPWYPGRFATAGPSYLGVTQWAVADAAPGELVAMVPMVTTARITELLYPGGVLALENALWWMSIMAHSGPRGLRVLRSAMAARRLRVAMARLPVGELDRLAIGRRMDFWRAWVDHSDPNHPYWQARDYRAQVAATTAAVALIGGWYDSFLPGQLDDYAALVASGRNPRLVIGPWSHTDGGGQVGEIIAFLRAALGGAGAPDGPPVRLFVTGAGQWRDYTEWPPPGSRPAPWYLGPDGGLGPRPVGNTAAPSQFRYDPADPTPNIDGPRIQGRRQVPQGALEARKDVLVFTSPVLDQPLDVIGPVAATVYLRSSVERSQVFVRLSDVDPAGRSLHVCDGIQGVDNGGWPADEAGVRRVEVRMCPTAHQFAAGHRLRVLIAGGAHPRFVRAFGTGAAIGTATQGQAADHDLLHDPGHPSRIELPLFGDQPSWSGDGTPAVTGEDGKPPPGEVGGRPP
jgi:putative CocE/NonD family hydrolase